MRHLRRFGSGDQIWFVRRSSSCSSIESFDREEGTRIPRALCFIRMAQQFTTDVCGFQPSTHGRRDSNSRVLHDLEDRTARRGRSRSGSRADLEPQVRAAFDSATDSSVTNRLRDPQARVGESAQTGASDRRLSPATSARCHSRRIRVRWHRAPGCRLRCVSAPWNAACHSDPRAGPRLPKSTPTPCLNPPRRRVCGHWRRPELLRP